MTERLRVLEERYRQLAGLGLNLDITRGKPSPEQLDLANGLFDNISGDKNGGKNGGKNANKNANSGCDWMTSQGVDIRNYGGVDGIPEAKKLFAEYLEVGVDEIVIGGNSSLALMHDTVMRAVLFGVPDGDQPWGKGTVKFLCPVPGYDRHFAICELFGIEMIPINLGDSGLDVETIERLVAEDDSIKGIWCVPKYSNPTGHTYTEEACRALAAMKTKAADFRIFWDNAYAAHHLKGSGDSLPNMMELCKAAGHPNRLYIFGSTSKITFAGAGLSFIGGSVANIAHVVKYLSLQTIGPDKVNQLRHVRFLKNVEGIHEHMRQHARLMQPKFDVVNEVLTKELGHLGIANWTEPRGGYFVSFNGPISTAKRTVAMCKEIGVKFTQAGMTFPYGKDPSDRNIRIAPSCPSVEELRVAIEVLAVCVQLASLTRIGDK